MSIRLGNIDFDGPYPITEWISPYQAAVYAIMMKPDPENKPKEYRVIYFGGGSNLSEIKFYREKDKYNCWIREADSEDNLYIGIYKMPNSTADERIEIESNLINQYNPVCN